MKETTEAKRMAAQEINTGMIKVGYTSQNLSIQKVVVAIRKAVRLRDKLSNPNDQRYQAIRNNMFRQIHISEKICDDRNFFLSKDVAELVGRMSLM